MEYPTYKNEQSNSCKIGFRPIDELMHQKSGKIYEYINNNPTCELTDFAKFTLALRPEYSENLYATTKEEGWYKYRVSDYSVSLRPFGSYKGKIDNILNIIKKEFNLFDFFFFINN